MHGSTKQNAHISFLIKVINKPAAFDYGFNHWYSCDEVLK
jgi:hypothetical protein